MESSSVTSAPSDTSAKIQNKATWPRVCQPSTLVSMSWVGLPPSIYHKRKEKKASRRTKTHKRLLKKRKKKKKNSKYLLKPTRKSKITKKKKTHKWKHRVKGGLPPRAKSTNSRPSKPQTRTLRSNMSSAGVYKTHSDTSLVNGIQKISLRSNAGTPSSGRSVRRRSSSADRACKTLEDIADTILRKQAKNIVVMAGAGISTSSGIPDFRTPGTGLYDNLKQYKIPYPQAIFDIDYFEYHPKPFYTIAKELYPTGRYRPNYVHYFLRLLHEKGLLLRLYTQNIDGLERMVGIPDAKLVEAHGSFLTASCIRCKQKQVKEDVKNAIFSDKVPRCMQKTCTGLVKPDIVFFGEDLPRRFYYYLKDFPQADLLIVMGTSLEVEPFAGIVDATRFYIPRVLFNREAVGPFSKKRRMSDVAVEGDLLERIKMFVDMLGWKKEMDKLIESDKERLKAEYPVEPVEINLSNIKALRDKDSSEKTSTKTESESGLSDTVSSSGSSQSGSRSNSRTKVTNNRTTGLRSNVTKGERGITGLNRPMQRTHSISARPKLEGTRFTLNRNKSTSSGTDVRRLPKLSFQHRNNVVNPNMWRPSKKDSSSSSESSDDSSDDSSDED